METTRIYCFLFWILSNVFCQNTTFPVVDTKVGRIQGKYAVYGQRMVTLFHGIPYGIRPTGQYRFVKPLKQLNLGSEIYDGRNQKEKCFKSALFGEETTLHESTTASPVYEDCLYLDIILPHNIKPGINLKRLNLPVIILLESKNNEQLFNITSYFVQYNDVIVVRVDFRSGVFGFFGTGDFGLGNYGLFDQQLGIKWIYDNIRDFGGDPDNVTLIGIGENGIFAGLHAVSTLSYPYVRRVLMHGYTPLHHMALEGNPKQFALNLATISKCPLAPNSDMLECLRKIKASTLHKMAVINSKSYGLGFRPVLDGDFLTDFPEKSLQSQIPNSIDFMIGTIAESAQKYSEKLNTQNKVLKENDIYKATDSFCKQMFGPSANKISRLVQVEYSYCHQNQSSRQVAFSDLVQDVSSLAPVDLAVRLYSGYSGRMFYYNVLDDSGSAEISHQLLDYWIKFALLSKNKSNRKNQSPWPPYRPHDRVYMQFSTGTSLPRLSRDFKAVHMEFWNQYVRAVRQHDDPCSNPALPCEEHIKELTKAKPTLDAFWIVLGGLLGEIIPINSPEHQWVYNEVEGFLVISVVLNVAMAARFLRKDTRLCYRTCCCKPIIYEDERFIYRAPRFKNRLPYFDE